jgi:hypothetical protein
MSEVPAYNKLVASKLVEQAMGCCHICEDMAAQLSAAMVRMDEMESSVGDLMNRLGHTLLRESLCRSQVAALTANRIAAWLTQHADSIDSRDALVLREAAEQIAENDWTNRP